MKIISRYILREHFGPFVFAFFALTSLMLLNFISRQMGELVGKGLPLTIIAEFVLLSIPLTVALTGPMSVLVAVLYAFTQLAAENEITALKASGVSPWRIVTPTLITGVVLSILFFEFNDQVLPRSNHELKNLQEDISQAKPTLLLKEQVINPISEGKLYLKADKIDQSLGRLSKVVIYDLTNQLKRRTIYADSGRIQFASNRVDLDLELFSGQMLEVETEKPSQLERLFYRKDRIRVRDVGRDFKKTAADSNSKGDREMSVCEMQTKFWQAEQNYANTLRDIDQLEHPAKVATAAPLHAKVPEPRGLGWAYCRMLELVPSTKEAHAADVDHAVLHRASAPQDSVKTRQDSVKTRQDSVKIRQDSVKPATTFTPPVQSPTPVAASPPGPPPAAQAIDTMQQRIAAQAAAEMMKASQGVPAATPPAAVAPSTGELPMGSRGIELKIRRELAQRGRNRYDIEIHKKFSLAAACLIFCILAPPIALRFPRGGVGLVIGVSLVVFALYYVGLIGGEAMANKGILPPFWAMWGTNVLLTVIGFIMLLRIGRESSSSRGGGMREWLDTRRMLRDEQRAANAGRTA